MIYEFNLYGTRPEVVFRCVINGGRRLGWREKIMPDGILIEGTEENDTLLGFDIYDLTGLPSNDTLLGFGGDDRLDGLAGDDLLDGGTGDDYLLGRDCLLYTSDAADE